MPFTGFNNSVIKIWNSLTDFQNNAAPAKTLVADEPESIFNALAFYSILAWKMLALNHLIKEQPQEPTLNIFDEKEVAALHPHFGTFIRKEKEIVSFIKIGDFIFIVFAKECV